MWNSSLARDYIDQIVRDAETFRNAGEAQRLRGITDAELSHPALMRSFVRGACGFDLALDESMVFFYAICLGDEEIFGDLMRKHNAMTRSSYDAQSTTAWRRAQEAFWSRPDIAALEKLAESTPAL